VAVIKRLLSTIEIARPHNMVAAGACVVSAYHLSGGRGVGPVLWPVVFTALVAGLGNLVNDVFDTGIDRVNKPRRPIPSGRLSARHVFRVYLWGTLLVTAAMGALLPDRIFALALAWEALLFFYAARIKRSPLLGNVVIAAVCASAFMVGALVTGRYGVLVFPAAFAFVLVMGRELVKGAEDVEGDRLAGARTLAVRYGATRAAKWGAMLLFVCAAAAPVPAVAGYFGRTYGLLSVFLVTPGILAAAVLVLKSPGKTAFNRASWILKIEMFLGIIVMGFGLS
jgi:geranylgeranylglycerol-phosphate geranylgeranyltransferase